MAGKLEQFKSLPVWVRVLIVVIAVGVGYGVYAATSAKVGHDRAVSACKDAVRKQIHNQSAVFGEDPNVEDAAEGRFAVTGTVSANGVSVTYDCLVDGDGSNADVELLGP